jgi:nitroreductase
MDMMFDLHNETRGVILDRWENYRKFLKGAYLPRNADMNFEHTARQSYIGLGFAMAAAAIEKVDATPMEGFDAAKLDLILNLKEKGLRSVTMLPLGYRDSENDWNVNLKKVRRSKENFVIEYK